jgi:hypothetical protein
MNDAFDMSSWAICMYPSFFQQEQTAPVTCKKKKTEKRLVHSDQAYIHHHQWQGKEEETSPPGFRGGQGYFRSLIQDTNQDRWMGEPWAIMLVYRWTVGMDRRQIDTHSKILQINISVDLPSYRLLLPLGACEFSDSMSLYICYTLIR